MIAFGHVLNCNVFTSCRVIRFMVRHVKYFLGLRYQVSGWEHLQTDGPYVIISNHQSSLDVLGERIHSTKQHNTAQHNTVCSVLLLLLPQDQNLLEFSSFCLHTHMSRDGICAAGVSVLILSSSLQA